MGLWFYVMKLANGIHEWLVCCQDYLIRRDVVYDSGSYDEKWRTLSGFQVLTKRPYCTKWSAGSLTVLCFTWHILCLGWSSIYVVLVLLQYCVSHDTFSQGWSHIYVVLVVHITRKIFSQGWSHIYVVLVLLQYCVSHDTYSHSRLIVHICCAGSPTVLWFT